jgi:hypothetical protein
MDRVPTFIPPEIDAIREYCEEQLLHEVVRMAVVVRDHGAAIGVMIEMHDGYRLAELAVADGGDDQLAGVHLVDALRRRMKARQH